MASIISVDTIQGLTGGQVTLPTGHKIKGTDVGSLNAPGHLINYAYYVYAPSNDNYTTVSSGTVWDTPVSIAYTPKFSNSLLIVKAECNFRCSPSYGVSGGIKRDGTKVSGNYNRSGQFFFYKEMTTNHHVQVVCTVTVPATSTSATTFTLWVEPYNGAGDFSNGWGRDGIEVWEIAQ